MRHLGIITMYYPFIDEETKAFIETSMQKASNYNDFVEILSDRVFDSETSDTLKYLAALHAWRLSATEVKRRLFERFRKDPIIKSWTAPHHTMEIDDLLGTLEDAIRVTRKDWLRIELLCLKIWCEQYRVVTGESLDTKRAMSLQEEAYKLVKTFGSTQKIAEAMTDMGRISECLGEYDFAISCYENSIETYGNPEMELYRETVASFQQDVVPLIE